MFLRQLVGIACAFGFAMAGMGVDPVRAQQPSEAAVALSMQVIETKGVTKVFDPLVPGVVEQAKNLFLQTNPNLNKELNEVAAQLRTEFGARRSELNKELARVYAQRFSEQELKDALAFYRSPLGKKLLLEEAGFVEQTLSLAQSWANKMSEQVIDRMRAEMKKKGHNL